jgi:hypothetical protein
VNASADLEAIVKQARTPQSKVRAFLDGRNRYYVQLAADLRISQESFFELLAQAEPLRRWPQALEAAPLEELIKDGNAQGVFAVRSPGLVAAGVTACLHGADGYLLGPGAPELQEALVEVYEVFVRGLLAPAGGPAGQRGRGTLGSRRPRAAAEGPRPHGVGTLDGSERSEVQKSAEPAGHTAASGKTIRGA